MSLTTWAEVIGKDMARRGEPPPPAGLPRRALAALQRLLGPLTLGEQLAAGDALRCAWARAQRGGTHA
jgi:hypothetical protein